MACLRLKKREEYLEIQAKTATISKYRRHDTDTGSTEVQISILTERIRGLTEHFKIHRRDAAGRRGLQLMVGKRRRLLDFLAREDVQRYRILIESLGLRK